MGILNEKDFIEKVKNLQEISFKAGERKNSEIMDSHDFRYVQSGEFYANLHIHTQFSDGTMTVRELLEKSQNKFIAMTDPEAHGG